MSYKKILALFIVLLAIFSTVNMASAGWFDFGGDSSDDSAPVIPSATVEVIDSYINYECVLSGNGLYIESDGQNASVQYDESKAERDINYDGAVVLNVSSLNQDELEKNLTNNWELSFKCSNLTTIPLGSAKYDYTLEDGILTIYFNGTDGINTYDPPEPGTSGTYSLDSGYISFFPPNSWENTTFMISF